MKAIEIVLFGAVFSAAIGGMALATRSGAENDAKKIARGKYLVTFGGCSDCHTPIQMGPKGPQPDMSRFLAGHPEDANYPPPPKLAEGPWFAVVGGMTAWSGPWGVSYAANLTPDTNTGIGTWTEDIFIEAMRTGKHYGVARDILPPMPWQSVAVLTEEDMKAVFAYLKSLPAIRNQVPQPEPPGGPITYE
ncbi:MAG TPA: c-type cytochrome [Clostridia bacterium]|nr:c-type cytochrome [Clostridia bacterium]